VNQQSAQSLTAHRRACTHARARTLNSIFVDLIIRSAVGMCRSQLKSESVGFGFCISNQESDTNSDLSHDCYAAFQSTQCLDCASFHRYTLLIPRMRNDQLLCIPRIGRLCKWTLVQSIDCADWKHVHNKITTSSVLPWHSTTKYTLNNYLLITLNTKSDKKSGPIRCLLHLNSYPVTNFLLLCGYFYRQSAMNDEKRLSKREVKNPNPT